MLMIVLFALMANGRNGYGALVNLEERDVA
jgi:hypothetical protein